MAAITFASMVPDVSAFLQGCPNPAIERTLRKIATDLCQRASVWKAELPAINTAIGTTSYTPTSPVAYGEFAGFVSGTTTVSGTTSEVKWVSYDKARRLYPSWPLNTSGTPLVATSRTPGELMLAPTPDAVGTLNVYGLLRPTATADSWDAQLYREFHRVLFHGSMHELMSMPGRSWSNPKDAMYHGKQWSYLLALARDRAERDYNSDTLSVQMLPAA